MLTREAFNALLKTLEEPPANVVFVLATTEPHKIPETIISRCQRFDFRRPQVRDIARLLATIVERENARPDDERGGPRIEIQEAALEEIARHSQGGFRDAIGTLDKLITYSDGAIKPADVLDALGVTDADLLFEITDIVTERRTAEALQFVQRLANDGTDYSQFIRDLLRHLRQLFLLQHLEESARDDAALRALGQTVELDEQLLEPPAAAGQQPARRARSCTSSRRSARRSARSATASTRGCSSSWRWSRSRGRSSTTRRPPSRSACAASRPGTAAAGRRGAAAGPRRAPRTAPGRAAVRRGAARRCRRARDAARGARRGRTAPPPRPRRRELTLERVKRAWELILQRVQTSSVSLYAMLRDARPSALDGRPPHRDHAVRLRPDARPRGRQRRAPRRRHRGRPGPAAAARVRAGRPARRPRRRAPRRRPAPQTIDFTALIKQAKGTFDAEELPDDS